MRKQQGRALMKIQIPLAAIADHKLNTQKIYTKLKLISHNKVPKYES